MPFMPVEESAAGHEKCCSASAKEAPEHGAEACCEEDHGVGGHQVGGEYSPL